MVDLLVLLGLWSLLVGDEKHLILNVVRQDGSRGPQGPALVVKGAEEDVEVGAHFSGWL